MKSGELLKCFSNKIFLTKYVLKLQEIENKKLTTISKESLMVWSLEFLFKITQISRAMKLKKKKNHQPEANENFCKIKLISINV